MPCQTRITNYITAKRKPDTELDGESKRPLLSHGSGQFEGPRQLNELLSPQAVAKFLPCTLHLNVLPKDLVKRLVSRFIGDSEDWPRNQFWLFERHITSPHQSTLYLDQDILSEKQQNVVYNGAERPTRDWTPELAEIRAVIAKIVQTEMAKRTQYLLV